MALTPDEQDEYLSLLEEDRLLSKDPGHELIGHISIDPRQTRVYLFLWVEGGLHLFGLER